LKVKQWRNKPRGDGSSARSVGWERNEEVTLLYLVTYPSAPMYSIQTQGSDTLLINTTDQNLH